MASGGGVTYLNPSLWLQFRKVNRTFPPFCTRCSSMLPACCSETVDIHCRGLRPAGMWHHLTGRVVLEVSTQRSRLIFRGRMSRAVTWIFRRQIRKHITCKIKKPEKWRGTVYTEPGVQYDTPALSHNTGSVSLTVLLPSIHSSHSPTSPRNNCSNRIIALFYSLISKLHPLLNHTNLYL